MAITKMLMKETWYPRIHDSQVRFGFGLETGVVNRFTNMPAIMYDEGLGSPSSFNSNPEHGSFAETAAPNCYPNSRVNKVLCTIEFALTKAALETDKLHMVRGAFMPIHTSFEDLSAKDEGTGETIASVLEMDSETTDRQAYPLWNDVDMPVLITGQNILAATVPSLNATQAIEGVAFAPETYYDAIHYYSIANKLKKVSSGLKWFVLTKSNPRRKFKIFLTSDSKFMNQYNYFGILCGFPQVATFQQIPIAADTTAVTHVDCAITTRYNEWHGKFNTDRQ